MGAVFLTCIIYVQLVCLLLFFVVLLRAPFFEGRVFWKTWLALGCFISGVSLLAEQVEVAPRIFGIGMGLFHHLGDTLLLTGAVGLHWKIWAAHLFEGSIFEKYVLPPKEEGQCPCLRCGNVS